MKRLKTNDDIIDYIRKPHIELIGNTECIIDGIKSIIEYTKGRIKVDTGKMKDLRHFRQCVGSAAQTDAVFFVACC